MAFLRAQQKGGKKDNGDKLIHIVLAGIFPIDVFGSGWQGSFGWGDLN
jgi:hypothetical protein